MPVHLLNRINDFNCGHYFYSYQFVNDWSTTEENIIYSLAVADDDKQPKNFLLLNLLKLLILILLNNQKQLILLININQTLSDPFIIISFCCIYLWFDWGGCHQ